MFFQKVFHVHQPLTETRRRLSGLGSFHDRLPGLKKAVFSADGVAQLECTVDPQLDLHAVLVELPTEEENHLLFQSTFGNVRVAGLLALTPIRPGVTEVHLTLDYSLCSLVSRFFDFCTRRVERYVEESIRALQGCLESELPAACLLAKERFNAPQLAH